MPAPALIVVGGLPATGKTAVSTALARRIGFAYLRIDTIEQAIVAASDLTNPLGPAGYVVGYRLAADQLRNGVGVIAECVNPLAVTRDAWRDTAAELGAPLVEVELICSDAAAHRRRAETRESGIPGHVPPSWQAIVTREYEPWNREHLVLDTARLSVAESVDAVANAIPGPPGPPPRR